MPSSFSRRTVLAGMAAAGLPCALPGQMYPDIPLDDLWFEMRAIITSWEKLGPKFPFDLIVRFQEVKDRMLDFRANELEGLLIRASAAAARLPGEPGYRDDRLEYPISLSVLGELLQRSEVLQSH